jgi:hypothetical protein
MLNTPALRGEDDFFDSGASSLMIVQLQFVFSRGSAA